MASSDRSHQLLEAGVSSVMEWISVVSSSICVPVADAASNAKHPAKKIPCSRTDTTRPMTLLDCSRFALIFRFDFLIKQRVKLKYRQSFTG
jgi:hypothetical protein